MAQRRQFSHEFKVEAVRRVMESGRKPGAVAAELGIRPDMLRTWRRQLAGAATAAEAFPGNGTLTSQDEELRRLRREVARLTQERDFLKSATVESGGRCNILRSRRFMERGHRWHHKDAQGYHWRRSATSGADGRLASR
jgi:transposase